MWGSSACSTKFWGRGRRDVTACAGAGGLWKSVLVCQEERGLRVVTGRRLFSKAKTEQRVVFRILSVQHGHDLSVTTDLEELFRYQNDFS